MFEDIHRERYRGLSHIKLDHISSLELLHADDTVFISKDTRTLYHVVEVESEYFRLRLSQSKRVATTTNRGHAVRFRDGTPVPNE